MTTYKTALYGGLRPKSIISVLSVASVTTGKIEIFLDKIAERNIIFNLQNHSPL